MKQKLVVVSMDALVYEDLEYLSQKPNFKAHLEEAAMVRRVRSIYPTLTYPCHATMATGTLPAKHGIVNNTFFVPEKQTGSWLWYHDSYKARDLFDACKEAGLTTASIGWPTTGNHPHVDWLVDEVAGTPSKTEEEFRRDYLSTGTPEDLWNTVCAPHIHWRTGPARSSGWFNSHVCCEIIRRFRPDLTLLHIGAPDHARHRHGVFGEGITPELDMCEEILGMLRQAIADSGGHINLVITADHGQLDVKHTCAPNAMLVEGGYITLDENGAVTGWRARCHGAGMSTQVHVKDPSDEREIYDFFKAGEGKYGYEKIYTREEFLEEGLAGDFAFVLETDGVTHLINSWTAPISVPGGKDKGTHGYHPDKGPRPTLLGAGPAFKTGAVVENARLVDGAPTWAHILGVSLPDADGKVLKALLR